MSLLLDARKKAELAQQQEDLRKSSDPGSSTKDAAPRSASTSPDGIVSGAAPHAGSQRAAGQNLFQAKVSPARPRMRLGIVPIALISGAVLAAAGSLYVWHEISPSSLAQQPRSPVPPAAVAPALPVAAAIIAKAPPAQAESDTAITEIFEPAEVAIAPKSPRGSTKPRKRTATPRTSVQPEQPIEVDAAASQGTEADDPRAIKIGHGSVATLDSALLEAYQAYQSGNLSTADRLYREVLQRDANSRDAMLGLAAIAQRQGRDATAANYYKQILTLDPRDPVALAGLSALPGAADATGTESRLKSVLAQQPQDSGAQSAALYFVLGNHYAAQSRWGDAQQSYFNAYKLEPGNAQIAFNLAVSLDHLQQGKLAAQYYERALQLDAANSAGFDHVQARQRIDELAAR